MSAKKIVPDSGLGDLGVRNRREVRRLGLEPRDELAAAPVSRTELADIEIALHDAGFSNTGEGLRVTALAFVRSAPVREAIREFLSSLSSRPSSAAA